MILNKWHIVMLCVALVSGILIGAGLRGCSKDKTDVEPIILTDTLSIHDTIRIEGRTITKYVTYHDTIICHVVDSTVMMNDKSHDGTHDGSHCDTIRIPIEHREYRDSIVTDSSRIAWRVQYQGYRAKIDSFGIDYTFQPRTIVKTNKKGFGQFVGIGVGVGAGVTLINQQAYASPYIGLHLTYGWGRHW